MKQRSYSTRSTTGQISRADTLTMGQRSMTTQGFENEPPAESFRRSARLQGKSSASAVRPFSAERHQARGTEPTGASEFPMRNNTAMVAATSSDCNAEAVTGSECPTDQGESSDDDNYHDDEIDEIDEQSCRLSAAASLSASNAHVGSRNHTRTRRPRPRSLMGNQRGPNTTDMALGKHSISRERMLDRSTQKPTAREKRLTRRVQLLTDELERTKDRLTRLESLVHRGDHSTDLTRSHHANDTVTDRGVLVTDIATGVNHLGESMYSLPPWERRATNITESSTERAQATASSTLVPRGQQERNPNQPDSVQLTDWLGLRNTATWMFYRPAERNGLIDTQPSLPAPVSWSSAVFDNCLPWVPVPSSSTPPPYTGTVHPSDNGFRISEQTPIFTQPSECENQDQALYTDEMELSMSAQCRGPEEVTPMPTDHPVHGYGNHSWHDPAAQVNYEV